MYTILITKEAKFHYLQKLLRAFYRILKLVLNKMNYVTCIFCFPITSTLSILCYIDEVLKFLNSDMCHTDVFVKTVTNAIFRKKNFVENNLDNRKKL